MSRTSTIFTSNKKELLFIYNNLFLKFEIELLYNLFKFFVIIVKRGSLQEASTFLYMIFHYKLL